MTTMASIVHFLLSTIETVFLLSLVSVPVLKRRTSLWAIMECHCGMKQCEELHKSIMETAPEDHPWREAMIRVNIHENMDLKSLLFLLGLCHHLKKPVIDRIIDGHKTLKIRRLHFPLPLLTNRETYEIKSPTKLLNPTLAAKIAHLDGGNNRLTESCNRVDTLIKLGRSIFPPDSIVRIALDRSTAGNAKIKADHFVQVPVGPMADVQDEITALKRPKAERLVYDTPKPPKKAPAPPKQTEASPNTFSPSESQCRAAMQHHYLGPRGRESTNFKTAMWTLKTIHMSLEPVEIDSDCNGKEWIYPCATDGCREPKISQILLDMKRKLPYCDNCTRVQALTQNAQQKRKRPIIFR